MSELPKGWRWATLDEAAEDINERVDKPAKSDHDRFVGLEHFESGEFTIKKWGSTQDVKSSMKLFKKRDLLFARRNAHLRRASMVDFNGVCSGDAFVLRQKPGILVNNYLPLIFNTDDLWDYAISNAAGSMSKRVKWRDLKEYEFPLPLLADQKRIAEVLWTVENSIWKTEDAIGVTERYKRTLMKHLFMYGPVSIGKSKQMKIKQTTIDWKCMKLKEVAQLKRGKFNHRPRNLPIFYGGDYPFIQTSDIAESDGIIRSYSQTLNDRGLAISKMFPKGTIVISIAGNIGHCAIIDFDSCFPDSIVGISPKENQITREYLFYFLRFSKEKLESIAPSTTQKNLNIQLLGNFNVPVPPVDEQMKIAKSLTELSNTLSKLMKHHDSLNSVKVALLNSLLSGEIRLGAIDDE